MTLEGDHSTNSANNMWFRWEQEGKNFPKKNVCGNIG
jgi:hypothetical protein